MTVGSTTNILAQTRGPAMSQPQVSRDSVPPDSLRDLSNEFDSRPASSAWEPLPIPEFDAAVWVWFKPPAAPNGLVFQVPDQVFQSVPESSLTLRSLVEAAAVNVEEISRIALQGSVTDGPDAATVLDEPIPHPSAEVDPQIFVWIGPPQPPSAALAGSESLTGVFQQIENDWRAAQKIERRLGLMRKKLAAMLGTLSALNRDLTADEGARANRNDLRDWRDARRWLRDCCSNLTRYIHECDVGDVSAAGRRRWLEQVYQQCVVPRQPFDGIEQAQREFEAYHKLVQNLQRRVQMTLATSTSDGERRAQQVLARIAAKSRKSPA